MTTEDIFNTPEKKYKRKHWLQAAEDRKQKNNVDFINYCTLPGKNCHDVFLLKHLLKTTKTGFRKESLTFFEKDTETIVDIWNNLPGARHYTGYFEIFIQAALDGINLIDNHSEEIDPLSFFPYDVINLDFTTSAFKHGGQDVSPQMSAIYQLFEIQSFKHKAFTLFLTFAGIRGSDDESGRCEVNSAIVNIIESPTNSEFKSKFETFNPGVTPPYYSGGGHRALAYKDFLLVGIPLIIINYGFSKNFDVKCTKRFSYVGTGNKALMVSFIFDCEYFGSSRYGGETIETSLALQPQRLCEIFNHYEDINELFEDHPEIKEEYL